MTTPRRPVVGLVTIGQSPRPDVVPDMAEIAHRAHVHRRFPEASRHPADRPAAARAGRRAPRHVVAGPPHEEEDPAAVGRAAEGIRGVGLVVMDCMGFRRKTRDEMRELTGG